MNQEQFEQFILERFEKLEERIHKAERLIFIGVGGLLAVNLIFSIYQGLGAR